jgi:hypothetical protein
MYIIVEDCTTFLSSWKDNQPAIEPHEHTDKHISLQQ